MNAHRQCYQFKMRLLIIFIISGLSAKISLAARYVPFMDEEGVRSCMFDKKFNKVNPSEFMILTENNQLFANGTFKVLQDINQPLKVIIKILFIKTTTGLFETAKEL